MVNHRPLSVGMSQAIISWYITGHRQLVCHRSLSVGMSQAIVSWKVTGHCQLVNHRPLSVGMSQAIVSWKVTGDCQLVSFLCHPTIANIEHKKVVKGGLTRFWTEDPQRLPSWVQTTPLPSAASQVCAKSRITSSLCYSNCCLTPGQWLPLVLVSYRTYQSNVCNTSLLLTLGGIAI